MNFEKVTAPAIDPGCSQELRDAAADIAGRIEELHQRRVELKARAAELEATPPEEFDFDAFDQLTRDEVGTLRAELGIRVDIQDVHAAHRRELSELADRAFKAHKQAEDTVKGRLEKAGYLPPSPGESSRGRYTPEFVMRHPMVLEKLGRLQELRDRSRCVAASQANAAAMEAVKRRLNSIKKKLLAVS